MKILRLYALHPAGEYTLCRVSNNAEGKSCVNDVETLLRVSCAGEAPLDVAERSLVIVLPPGAAPQDGYFLSAGENTALLRWRAKDDLFEVAAAGLLSVSAGVSMLPPLKTAVLTVSDKGSRGEREDTAGPALAALADSLGCPVEAGSIVPDEIDAITERVVGWCNEAYNLILITGGTGLSERDVTPEALSLVAEKSVPGFGEVMRAQTLAHTPRAFLSRSLAVIRGKTLIIAFPGSESAVRQCFQAISGGLRHGVETLAGVGGECGGHARRH